MKTIGDNRVLLTSEKAIAMLPDGEMIHTLSNPRAGFLCGADWERERLIDLIRHAACEKAGPAAERTGHGIVVWQPVAYDDKPIFHERLFVETK